MLINTFAMTKLMILTIHKEIPNLRQEQLRTIVLDSLFVDYFLFAQALYELEEQKLITTITKKNESELDAAGHPLQYSYLTDQGEHVLSTLANKLPPQVHNYIQKYAKNWRHNVKEENENIAQYLMQTNGSYQVQLSQFNGEVEVISLSILVPDKATAKQICNAWKENTVTIYQHVLATLLGNDKN